MSQLVACPECSKHLQVPDDLIGKKVQCPECKHTFTAKAPEEEKVKTGTTISKPPPSKTAAWDDDDDEEDVKSSKSGSGKKKRKDDDEDDEDEDDDDRPRRSKRRRSSSHRGSYAPHRGGMILAFGLIGLIGWVVGLGFISFIFSIIAWVMGNGDMAEIRAGRMDPEGEGTTSAGRIMGMIGTIFSIIAFVLGCGLVGCWFLLVMGLIGGAAAGGAARPPNNFQNRRF